MMVISALIGLALTLQLGVVWAAELPWVVCKRSDAPVTWLFYPLGKPQFRIVAQSKAQKPIDLFPKAGPRKVGRVQLDTKGLKEDGWFVVTRTNQAAQIYDGVLVVNHKGGSVTAHAVTLSLKTDLLLIAGETSDLKCRQL